MCEPSFCENLFPASSTASQMATCTWFVATLYGQISGDFTAWIEGACLQMECIHGLSYTLTLSLPATYGIQWHRTVSSLPGQYAICYLHFLILCSHVTSVTINVQQNCSADSD